MDISTIRQKLTQRTKKSLDIDRLVPASILMPLFMKSGALHVLFTKRTDHLEHHKGQISFPGGVFQPEDRELLITALRESEEEIGLHNNDVEILGELDDTITITQYRITPYVGVIPYPYPFHLNDFEVARLILAPLHDLMDERIQKWQEIMMDGRPYLQYVFQVNEDIIWGATARILKDFLDLLSN